MFAKEEGVPVDRIGLAAKIRAAVAGVVKKQVDSGIDLVNDGEMSKPSYATYVKDRLTGFAGSSNTFVYQDLSEFPNLAMRVFGDPGRSRRRTPACTGPIGVGDPAAPLADIDNLKAALAGANVAGAFLSAASPGVTNGGSGSHVTHRWREMDSNFQYREHHAMAPSRGFAAASHREAALRGAPSHGETAFRDAAGFREARRRHAVHRSRNAVLRRRAGRPLSGREARRHAVCPLRNPAGRKRDITIPQPCCRRTRRDRRRPPLRAVGVIYSPATANLPTLETASIGRSGRIE
jgi:hypothetical protein